MIVFKYVQENTQEMNYGKKIGNKFQSMLDISYVIKYSH